MAAFIDCNIDWVFLTAACSSDSTNTELVETTSEVSHPALVDGEFEVLEMETSGIGPWGFVRRADDETIAVIINFGLDEQEVVIGEFLFQAAQLVNLITGQHYSVPDFGTS